MGSVGAHLGRRSAQDSEGGWDFPLQHLGHDSTGPSLTAHENGWPRQPCHMSGAKARHPGHRFDSRDGGCQSKGNETEDF